MKETLNESCGMSKRQFVKCCLLGLGGVALGLDRGIAQAFTLHSGPTWLQASGQAGRWSTEAMFYVKTSHGVRCQKCPHSCELSEGESGRCRNRVNYDGKLYSIGYGNPCAVHIDPIEKKPFFHFLPSARAFSIAVAGCNLRCLNCQNWQISQVSPKETENVELLPADVVTQCIRNTCESIAYTYSEPTTFYEYCLETSKAARGKKIKNLLKSNGYINEEPLRRLCAHLDAANIDLKTFDDDTYTKLSQARLAPVLRTLKILREEGVWLEITNLIIPGWTDNLDTIGKMCRWLCENGLSDAPLHFSRFTPLYKLTQLPLTPVSTIDRARELAKKEGMQYVYVGNVPGHDGENTYCHHCGKLLIERKGFAILANHLEKGTCMYCREKVPGVWSA